MAESPCRKILSDILCDPKPKECSDYATIHTLPVEILDYIFSFLTIRERLETELVCRRWREVGQRVTWSWPVTLDIRDAIFVTIFEAGKLGKITPRLLPRFVASILARCGKSLKTVVIRRFRGEKYDLRLAITLIGQFCPNLSEIRIDLVGNQPFLSLDVKASLLNVANSCKKIKKVCLRNADVEVLVSPFMEKCDSCEHLILIDATGINANFVKMINTRLKGFHLNSLLDNSLATITKDFVNSCKSIEELSLLTSSQALVMRVLQCCANSLRVFNLCVWEAIDPEKWLEIFVSLPHLEGLMLRTRPDDSCGVGDNLMMVLVEKCTRLRKLRIADTDVTDVGIAALARAPSLRILDASHTRITGDGIQSLARQGRVETFYCTRIKHSHQLFEDRCIELAKTCPNLRFLDLSHNVNITNRLVKEICSLMEKGVIKGPLSLYVEGTEVTKAAQQHCRLKLNFKQCSNDFKTNYV